MIQPLGPGVYDGMTFSDYAALPYMNNGKIGSGMRSMRHLQRAMTYPDDFDSAALRLGRAVHTAVLEPDDFARRYVVLPETFVNSKGEDKPLNRMSKEGKAAIEQYERNHDVLKPDEYEQCCKIRDAVRGHVGATGLIEASEAKERVYVWEDEDSGVICKCRLDLGSRPVVDLKTTLDASARAFANSFARYGYHRQMAFYGDGAAAPNGCVDSARVIIAVEKNPPHAVAIYECDCESIAVGRMEYKKVLAEWAVACFDGVYPGYPEAPQPLSLPRWAVPYEEDE